MNKNLKINIFDSPFPHLTIEKLFTEGELELIWEEVNYIRKHNVKLAGFSSSKKLNAETGEIVDKASYNPVWFSDVFVSPESSIFASQMAELHYQGLFFLASQVDPRAKRYVINSSRLSVQVKLNIYRHGDYYDSHTDDSDFTSLFYLLPKNSTHLGGSLEFPEYGHRFPCHNNSLILFPGTVEHAVTKVTSTQDHPSDEPLRVALNTFYDIADNKMGAA